MQWCWDLEFFGPSHPHSNRFGYRSRLFKPISFFWILGFASGRLRKDKICFRRAAEQMDLNSKHHYTQLDLFCPQADATSSAITSDLHFPGGQLWIPKSFFCVKCILHTKNFSVSYFSCLLVHHQLGAHASVKFQKLF